MCLTCSALLAVCRVRRVTTASTEKGATDSELTTSKWGEKRAPHPKSVSLAYKHTHTHTHTLRHTHTHTHLHARAATHGAILLVKLESVQFCNDTIN